MESNETQDSNSKLADVQTETTTETTTDVVKTEPTANMTKKKS